MVLNGQEVEGNMGHHSSCTAGKWCLTPAKSNIVVTKKGKRGLIVRHLCLSTSVVFARLG
jgi:hypothetical protein